MNKIVIVVLSLLVIASCATSGPPFSKAPHAHESEALVYVMRSTVAYRGGYWTNFYVNDEEIVELFDSGYSWIHLKAGTYTFSTDSHLLKTLKFKLNVEPGETYYLVQDQKEFFPIATIKFQSIPAKDGERIIQNYAYKKANPLNQM